MKSKIILLNMKTRRNSILIGEAFGILGTVLLRGQYILLNGKKYKILEGYFNKDSLCKEVPSNSSLTPKLGYNVFFEDMNACSYEVKIKINSTKEKRNLMRFLKDNGYRFYGEEAEYSAFLMNSYYGTIKSIANTLRRGLTLLSSAV